MEWMLQVVDEVDDAIGAMRHQCFGIRVQIAVLLNGIGTAVLRRSA